MDEVPGEPGRRDRRLRAAREPAPPRVRGGRACSPSPSSGSTASARGRPSRRCATSPADARRRRARDRGGRDAARAGDVRDALPRHDPRRVPHARRRAAATPSAACSSRSSCARCARRTLLLGALRSARRRCAPPTSSPCTWRRSRSHGRSAAGGRTASSARRLSSRRGGDHRRAVAGGLGRAGLAPRTGSRSSWSSGPAWWRACSARSARRSARTRSTTSPSVTSWALPFEALYQAALAAITADTVGFTRLAHRPRPVRRRAVRRPRAVAVGAGLPGGSWAAAATAGSRAATYRVIPRPHGRAAAVTVSAGALVDAGRQGRLGQAVVDLQRRRARLGGLRRLVGGLGRRLDAERLASSPDSYISVTMSQPPTSSPRTKSCGIVGQFDSADSSWRMRGSGRMSTAANGRAQRLERRHRARGEAAARRARACPS